VVIGKRHHVPSQVVGKQHIKAIVSRHRFGQRNQENNRFRRFIGHPPTIVPWLVEAWILEPTDNTAIPRQ
jgi:hypothetical protein